MADDTVACLEADPPAPAAGEIIAHMTACGVCGSDALKVYNPGYAKPQKLGHECVGAVGLVIGLLEQEGIASNGAHMHNLAAAIFAQGLYETAC